MPPPFSMHLAQPWWLAAGVAAAGAVVLIHLLAGRRQQHIFYPAALLLHDSARAAARGRRPLQLLTLLIRSLALMCVGLMLARPDAALPESLSHAPRVPSTAPGTDLVIVLDVSASMSRVSATGATLDNEARAAARAALDALVPGTDRAALILAGRTPRDVATLSFDLDAARRELREARTTLESADGPAALRLAERILFRARHAPGARPARTPRIILCTDGQAPQWNDALAAAAEIPVHPALVAPGPGATPPLILERVSAPRAGPRPAVRALVRNPGPSAAPVLLRASSAGSVWPPAGDVIAPGLRSTIHLEGPAADDPVVRVWIESDGPLWMRERHALAPASPAARTLLVAPPTSALAASAAHALRAARPESPVERVTPGVARSALLSDAELAVFVDADPLDDEALRALRALRDRGGAVLRLSSEVAPDPRAAHALRLPDSGAAALSPGSTPESLTAAVQHADRAGPALMLRMEPGPEARSFAAGPVFAALLGRVLDALVPPDRAVAAPHAHAVGAPITQHALTEQFIEPLTDNLGRPARLDRSAAGPPTITLEPLDAPGVLVVRDAAGAVVARAIVDVDPAELDPDVAPRLSAPAPSALNAAAIGPDSRPRRTDLWHAAALLALILLTCEAALLSRRTARPAPPARGNR
ncbi:MAG: VWA domain-containing protein [Planctomycetota bacterium]|nr:VWA domain-containing protein [Planctomycetota bacterium]